MELGKPRDDFLWKCFGSLMEALIRLKKVREEKEEESDDNEEEDYDSDEIEDDEVYFILFYLIFSLTNGIEGFELLTSWSRI